MQLVCSDIVTVLATVGEDERQPNVSLIAGGTLSGQIHCFKESELSFTHTLSDACRGLAFSLDGQRNTCIQWLGLACISKDATLDWLDVETGKCTLRKKKCHS
jgi:hypothetical protein